MPSFLEYVFDLSIFFALRKSPSFYFVPSCLQTSRGNVNNMPLVRDSLSCEGFVSTHSGQYTSIRVELSAVIAPSVVHGHSILKVAGWDCVVVVVVVVVLVLV